MYILKIISDVTIIKVSKVSCILKRCHHEKRCVRNITLENLLKVKQYHTSFLNVLMPAVIAEVNDQINGFYHKYGLVCNSILAFVKLTQAHTFDSLHNLYYGISSLKLYTIWQIFLTLMNASDISRSKRFQITYLTSLKYILSMYNIIASQCRRQRFCLFVTKKSSVPQRRHHA